MRKIAIIGAGQAGLHLGTGLVRRGYDVDVFSNRTGDQIRSGRVLSSQALTAASTDLERAQGLDLLDTAPPIEGLHVRWDAQDGQRVTSISARRPRAATSIDQRLKMPLWMDYFEEVGGKLHIQDVGLADLVTLTETHDLVVVAAGKGEISAQFPLASDKVEFTSPPRRLILAYVANVDPHPDFEGNDFNKRDGVGELFLFPALSLDGPCHIVTMEVVPGGELDIFSGTMTPEEVVEAIKSSAERYFPSVAARLANAKAVDDQATLVGQFTPTRRHPIAVLSNGRHVLGLGDVLTLNDPLTGQGANLAAYSADSYLHSVITRGNEPFDRSWMERTYATVEPLSDATSHWTNATLREWPTHVRELFAAADDDAQLADVLLNDFGRPQEIQTWWFAPDSAQELLDRAPAERVG